MVGHALGEATGRERGEAAEERRLRPRGRRPRLRQPRADLPDGGAAAADPGGDRRAPPEADRRRCASTPTSAGCWCARPSAARWSSVATAASGRLADGRRDGPDPLGELLADGARAPAAHRRLRARRRHHGRQLLRPRARRGLRVRGADLLPRRARRPADPPVHPPSGRACEMPDEPGRRRRRRARGARGMAAGAERHPRPRGSWGDDPQVACAATDAHAGRDAPPDDEYIEIDPGELSRDLQRPGLAAQRRADGLAAGRHRRPARGHDLAPRPDLGDRRAGDRGVGGRRGRLAAGSPGSTAPGPAGSIAAVLVLLLIVALGDRDDGDRRRRDHRARAASITGQLDSAKDTIGGWLQDLGARPEQGRAGASADASNGVTDSADALLNGSSIGTSRSSPRSSSSSR